MSTKKSICNYCSNEFIVTAGSRGLYCSNKCSGKGNGILLKECATKKKATLEQQYLESPNMCNNCNIILHYNVLKNKFCTSRCAAIFNCTGRKHSDESKDKTSNTIKKMISSGELISSSNLKNYTRLKHGKYSIRLLKCIVCATDFMGKRKTCSAVCLKKHQQISGTNNIIKNRHKYLGRSQPSWMETTFRNWLTNHGMKEGINGFLTEVHFKFKHNTKTKNGWADFVFPRIKLIIELDGSHHKNRKELDDIRDKHLRDIRGYNVIRITHGEYVKKTRIEEIKNLLMF